MLKNVSILYIKGGGIVAITTKEGILKVLTAFNPWWRSGAVHPEFTKRYRRFVYYEAMKRLLQTDLRRTVILTGARRVGKTTVLYQMIQTLLSEGVPPRRILFTSLDHPMLKLAGLDDILSCYHENVYPDRDTYYFFDEIQYAADWALWLKTLYDTQPQSAVMGTGSASPILARRSSESGVGRWTVIPAPTLSFFEYCSLLNVEVPQLPPSVKPTAFSQMTHAQQTQIMMMLDGLQGHFNRYLQIGGFPELALSKDDRLAQQLMREDVVDKALKRDIPSLYNIRNPTELERIFLYLCNVSSGIVAIDAIARELNGVTRATVENYIQYLASANLIYISSPIEMGGRKILKARSKIYIADAAIRNAVLMDDSVLTSPEEMGKMVETAVYKHIATFYYKEAARIGYYRDGQDKEIDVVVDYPRTGNILIEVKYREQAHIAEQDALCRLAPQACAAILVTKRPADYGTHFLANGTPIVRIPAYAFLYLLGHAEQQGLELS